MPLDVSSWRDVVLWNTLTLRIALMLPIFFLQVFDLHEKIYSFRSWLGYRSGRSPLSCSSRVMMRLHTLHFASCAEGGSAVSGHI